MIRECNGYNIHFLLRNYLFMKNKVVPFSIFVMFRKIKTLQKQIDYNWQSPTLCRKKEISNGFCKMNELNIIFFIDQNLNSLNDDTKYN